MKRTSSQMHSTDKYSQVRYIIWSLSQNGWVFVYELNGSGFESSSSHLNFRYSVCFEQGVPWHSGNYRVWIHSETRTWHDKNIQSNAPYRWSLPSIFCITVLLNKLFDKLCNHFHFWTLSINPFLANISILYLLFSGVFRGYKMGKLPGNGLNI